MLSPGLDGSVWHSLLNNNQFPAALRATLISTAGSTLLALVFACLVASSLFGSRGWQLIQRQLPLFLAYPHVAFAIGIAFLVSPSGWIARGLANLLGWTSPPQWITVQDPWAMTLMLTLVVKETWFLLWILTALLGEQSISKQLTVANSLGYGKRQVWLQILLPQLLPRMGWPLVAVMAYSLSVVDMAQVLGPSTPPTLAVLGWQWLNDPDITLQALGSAVALLMMLLLGLLILSGRVFWTAIKQLLQHPSGIRKPSTRSKASPLTAIITFLPGWLALLLLGIWSAAGGWFFPDFLPSGAGLKNWLKADLSPMLTALWIGLATVSIALPLTLLWLEWGFRRFHGWIYAPLILPSLPIAAAQYSVLLHINLDSTAAGVIWSHLAWTLPYMILMLVGPYYSFDQRYLLTARALGHSRLSSCLRIKWPLLLKPILAATAVGFAVSIAQYLPTLFAGGGRFETVTTEAVALSAGGNRRVVAVHSLLQTALPLVGFILAIFVAKWQARHRLGLQ